MFGYFDLLPGGHIARNARVRDHPVMPASGAVEVGRACLDHPIANAEVGIGTTAIELLIGGKRPPLVVLRFKRGQYHYLGNEAETTKALFARAVLKVEQLPAMLAFE
jgi:hypothetical protein